MSPGPTGGFEMTEEQELAVACDSKDILLEAGAGSGKTSTTVARYMRLLDDGIDPTAILVFTFTDKAATELRDEVRKSRSAKSGPGGFSMSSAWVGTFHAICLRILQAYPIAAEVDPDFQVLDDVNAETVKAAAFNRSLTEFAEDEERVETLGLFREGPLRDTVSAVYEELRSRGHVEPRLPDFDPTDPSPALEALRDTVGPTLGSGKLRGDQKTCVEALDRLFDGKEISEIRREEIEAHRFGSKVPELLDHCEACRAAIASMIAAESGDLVRRHIGELLEIYSRRYAEAKRDASMLDYEDLQLIAVKLLGENPAIADSYRERFSEIMVDEFQDTNRLQLNLIELLRGEQTRLFTVGDEMQAIYGFRHADVELFRERRRTEGVNALSLTANFRSQAAVIGAVNLIGESLDRQAEAVHASGGTEHRHQFAQLTVGADADGERSWAELHLTDDKGWKSLDLGGLSPAISAEIGKTDDGHFEAEALSLAHRLRELVDEGRFSQSQIVILLRARTRIDLYRRALEQVGLSPYIVGGTGFWESREATDMRSLLSLLANPLDDEALIAVATSPACGLSTDALWLLREAAGREQPLWTAVQELTGGYVPEDGGNEILEQVRDSDVELITELAERVRSIRARAPVVPLAVTVESAFTATGYDLASLTRNPDATGLANLRRVMTLAHEFESVNGRDLRDFLRWIDLSAGLDSESPAASIDEESDVIRLMTVHKAKGLEFDLVCLPDLKRGNRSNQDGSLILGKPADPERPDHFEVGMRLPNPFGKGHKLYEWEKLAANKKTRESDEELRLFHVALTRARRGLIMSGITTGSAPGEITESTSMSDRMLKALEIDPGPEPPDPVEIPGASPAGPGPDLPATTMAINLNHAEPARAEVLAGSEPRKISKREERPGRPPLRRPERILYPDVPLSFTAISEYTSCPARFFARRVLRLEAPDSDHEAAEEVDRFGRGEATGFGLAVHDLLEAVSHDQWLPPDRESIEAALRSRGLDPGGGSRERADEMIGSFLESELADRIRDGETMAELPLLARIGGVTIRGFADLILMDPERPLVLDYKTNRLDGALPVEKMEDYLLQRDLYALSVARSGSGDPVETAFVFLEDADAPVLAEYAQPGIEAAEARLSEVVDEIKAGRFFGGRDATSRPCENCWACEALAAQRERAA